MMKKIKSKTLLLLVCGVVATAGLFLNEYYIKERDILIYNLVMTVSVTLLTTAIFSFFSNMFTTNDVEEVASENFTVLKYCQEYGLRGIYEKFPLELEEFQKDFIDSENLFIIMNDGKAFISSNMLLFENRIKTKNKKTTFIIQDYDSEDIMSALTRKNGHIEDPNYYKNKIISLIQYHMKELNRKCNKNHNLSVYLNPNYNTLAMILTDKYAMLSIYRVAPGKTRVPHFVFDRGKKEYDDVYNDIMNIKDLAKQITL